MKNLFNVFKFELLTFIQNKSYIISTAIIAVIIAIVMFLPNFVDLGLDDDTSNDQAVENNVDDEKDDEKDNELTTYLIYDESDNFYKIDELNELTKELNIEFVEAKSIDALKKDIKSEKYDAGFVIKNDTEYEYYVNNKEMFSADSYFIDNILQTRYQMNYCEANNLNFEEISALINTPITYKEHVLGKDSAESYWYCYALVIVVFMMIILYGVMIATSVTSEKSNRSIEVLVTSVNTNVLLFGKVLAGAVASFLQIAIILIVAVGGYKANIDVWNHSLDMLLNIDPQVLATFALFGVTGFIFYAFLYGAVGALVSKTEDINKSAGSVQMIIMIVYFVVLFQMSNIDGIVMKVASFLPVSSYSAMFIRVAMGNVALWEIIVSYVILIISTILVGFIGAKIFRMGTLRYGNPIKITTALKSLKKND